MGSPTIFKGKFTKLLTQKGILKSDGSIIENDGGLNLVKNSTLENGLDGWQLATFNHTTYTGLPTLGAPDLEVLIDSTNPLFGSNSMILKNQTTSPVWPAGQGIIYDLGTIPDGLVGTPSFVGGFNWQLPDLSQASNADFLSPTAGTFRALIYDSTINAWIELYNYSWINNQPFNGYLGPLNGDLISNFYGGFSTVNLNSNLILGIFAVAPTTGPITLKFDNFFVGDVPSRMIYGSVANAVQKSGDTMTGDLYTPNLIIDPSGGAVKSDQFINTAVGNPITITTLPSGTANTSKININTGIVTSPGFNTGDIDVITGYATGGGSGFLNLKTGTGTGSGEVTLESGAGDGSPTSITGAMWIGTGNSTNQSGTLEIKTGTAESDSGYIKIQTGVSATNAGGSSGNLELNTGDCLVSGGVSGGVSITTGGAISAGANSGQITIQSGGADNFPGDILLQTGISLSNPGIDQIRTVTSKLRLESNNIFVGPVTLAVAPNDPVIKTYDLPFTVTDPTNDLWIRTGNHIGGTSTGNSGELVLFTGDVENSTPYGITSGDISIVTGQAITGNEATGAITIRSNNTLNAASGNVQLGTGDGVHSGSLSLYTGAGYGEYSGGIDMRTGNVQGGTFTNPYNSGSIQIHTGNNDSFEDTGYVEIFTGNSGPTATGGSGYIRLKTGLIDPLSAPTAKKGPIYFDSPEIILESITNTTVTSTDDIYGSIASTKDVIIKTGDNGTIPTSPISAGNSGVMTIKTGDIYYTGPGTGTTSGQLNLKSGDSPSQPGNVWVQPGSNTSGGTGGDLFLMGGSGVTNGSIYQEASSINFTTYSSPFQGNANITVDGVRILNKQDFSIPASYPGSLILVGSGANEISVNASQTLASSYTITLPDNPPVIGQSLQSSGTKTIWDNPRTAKEIFRGYLFQNNSTTVTTQNMTTYSAASNLTGTLSAVAASYVSVASIVSHQIRARIGVSTPAANGQCGIRSALAHYWVGGGFRFSTAFAYSDSGGTGNSGARQFYGLSATTAILGISSTVTVQSLLNMIGVGSDAGDTALSIYHNDGSGTATKITLDSTDFPANRGASVTTDMFGFELYNPSGSGNVYYKLVNMYTLATAYGVITTDLPAQNTGLAFQAVRTSGSSSNACSMDLTHIGVHSV